MTMLEIITTARHLLSEATEGFWENTELLVYGDDCQEDLIKRLPLVDILALQVRKEISVSADTDILLPSSGVFAVPTDFLRMGVVAGKVGKHNAEEVQLTDLWDYQEEHIVPSTEEPVYYLSYFTTSKKAIVFSPTEATILLLYYKKATKFADTSATPEVAPGTHSLFVPYLCYRALLKDGEMTLALGFKKEYEEGIRTRGGQ